MTVFSHNPIILKTHKDDNITYSKSREHSQSRTLPLPRPGVYMILGSNIEKKVDYGFHINGNLMPNPEIVFYHENFMFFNDNSGTYSYF